MYIVMLSYVLPEMSRALYNNSCTVMTDAREVPFTTSIKMLNVGGNAIRVALGIMIFVIVWT